MEWPICGTAKDNGSGNQVQLRNAMARNYTNTMFLFFLEEMNYALIQYMFPDDIEHISPKKRKGKPFVPTAPSVKKKIKEAVQTVAGPRTIAGQLSSNMLLQTVPGTYHKLQRYNVVYHQ